MNMKNKLIKWIAGLAFTFILFLLGSVKVYYSARLNIDIQSGDPNPDTDPIYSIINASPGQLKWIMTIILTSCYCIVFLAISKLLIGSGSLLRIFLIIYVSGIVFSGICLGLFQIFNDYHIGYTIAHRTMNILQSPIPLIVILPSLIRRFRT